MAPVSMPAAVEALALELFELDGANAVALGGSRALGTNRPDSDWDLGVYYRGMRQALDPEDVRALGHEGFVSELGEWGPIVNGGAWLTIDETAIDVLFRDLDAIETWLANAEQGSFEILSQNGYIVGAPTYLPVGELAVCKVIHGELPRPDYPQTLADAAASVWNGRAGVALMFAHGYAELADVTCCCGMLVNAVLCVAHARLAARREWVLNEKRLVERAGVSELEAWIGNAGSSSERLAETVSTVESALDVERLSVRDGHVGFSVQSDPPSGHA